MKKINLVNILNIIYLLNITIIIINSFFNYKISDFYFKEFFLNYSDGFLRRAIDGEIIYYLSFYTKISPLIFLPIISSIIIILFFVLLIRFISRNKYLWIVIFSMPVLLSEIYYGSIFRKDISVLLLLLLQFTVIIKWKEAFSKNIILCLISIFSIFFHEIFFFLSLVPLLILLISPKYRFTSLLLLGVNLILFLLAYKYSGYKIDSNVIINSWEVIDKNVEPYLMRLNKILYVRSTLITKSSNWNLFTALNFVFFLFVNFYFIMGVVASKIENHRKNVFVFTLVLNQVVLVFLCAIAVDFSRWFFMVNLTSIIFPYLIDDKFLEVFNDSTKTLAVKLQKIDFYFNYRISYYLFLFLGMPFFGLWDMKEYFSKIPISILLSAIVNYK